MASKFDTLVEWILGEKAFSFKKHTAGTTGWSKNRRQGPPELQDPRNTTSQK